MPQQPSDNNHDDDDDDDDDGDDDDNDDDVEAALSKQAQRGDRLSAPSQVRRPSCASQLKLLI